MIASLKGYVVATSTTDPRTVQSIKIPAGETGTIDIAVTHEDGSAYDLTGSQLLFSLRGAAISRQATIDVAASGTAHFPLVIADTVALLGSYTYDVWLTDPSGNRYQVVLPSTFVVTQAEGQPGQPVTVPATQEPLAQGPKGDTGPTGAPGGMAKFSAASTLKAQTVPSDGTVVYLSGYYADNDGGGGVFVYNASSVAADDGGAVIAPNAGSGRWLRVFDKPNVANPKWWGAKDDSTLAFDSYPAFAAAYSYLKNIAALGSTYPSGALRVTGRYYRLGQAFNITNEIDIEGDGMGFNTTLYFYNKQSPDTPIDGIVINPATGAGVQSYSSIRNLKLKGYTTTNGNNSPSTPYYNLIDHLTNPTETGHSYVAGNGIVMFARANLERVNVESFAYDGIHINSTSSTNNANVFSFVNCVVNNNGRHGVYTEGDNGNAGWCANLDANNNGGFGICEHSFLGNTYEAGQIADNGDFIRDVTCLAHAGGTSVFSYGTERTIFAGSSVQGGVHVTTDAGLSWQELDLGYQDAGNASLDVAIRNLATRALVMSSSTLFAATPWGCFSLAGPTDYGSGNVWSKVSTGLSTFDGLSIAYDSAGNKLYYGTNGGGVFLSANAGTSWTAVNTGLGNLTVNALACDPANSGTVYAGTASGVYKTTNSGTSWAAMSTGFGSTIVNSLAMITGALFAGCADGKVYKSTDGSTWTIVFTESGGNAVTSVALNAANSSNVLAATNGGYVYVSADGGSTWTQKTSGLTNYITSTACSTFASALVTANGVMFVGATGTYPFLYAQTGGVFYSTDNGNTWTQTANATPKHGGSVRSTNTTNQSTFVGTYMEADQTTQLVKSSVSIGGILGQTVSFAQAASGNFNTNVFGQGGIQGLPNYCPQYTVPKVFQPSASTTTSCTVNAGVDSLVYADMSLAAGQLTIPAPSTTNSGSHVIVRRIDATTNACHLVAAGGTFSSSGTNHLYLYAKGDYVHFVSDFANSQWRVYDRGQAIPKSYTTATLPNPASVTIDNYALAYVTDATPPKFQYFNGTAWTDLVGASGGTQNGTTSASHVPYASSANTLSDGELSFNSVTHTYSVGASTVVDLSASSAAMKGPTGGVSNLATTWITEKVINTTAHTNVITTTPPTDGQYLVNVYYRVFTATTVVTITIEFNDAGGSKTITLVNAASQPVGSYTVQSLMVTAKASIALGVFATMGTANQTVVSASLVRLN